MVFKATAGTDIKNYSDRLQGYSKTRLQGTLTSAEKTARTFKDTVERDIKKYSSKLQEY